MTPWLLSVVWAAVASVPDARPASMQVATQRRVPLASPTLRARTSIHQRALAIEGTVVRGAFETVERGAAGAVVVTAARYPTAAPQFMPFEARVPLGSVAAIVAEHLRQGEEPALEKSPQLVYLLVLGHPVLAWEAQLSLTLTPEPSRRTLWISAMTGRLLEEHEQVLSSRARVFPENPAATPEPITVQLTGLDATEAGVPLDGARVNALNCGSEEPAEVPAYIDGLECFPAHVALSDENGDFFTAIPNVANVHHNRDPEDPYSELSMYYHAEKFLDRMAQLGVEEFACDKATLLANFHEREPSGDLAYSPVNNAFYTNQCDPDKGVTMLFGQGSDVDFGWDGDVVYHELGHGMVALLAPEGLTGRSRTPQGDGVDPVALNEGLADYFAFLMTDDPLLAEYVGVYRPSGRSDNIRSGLNGKVCPRDLVGQVHNDGEPFMAALWSVRAQLGEVVDTIVIEAVTRMAPGGSLEDGASRVVEVARERRDGGTLTDDDVVIFERAFSARNLLQCDRVITDPALVSERGKTLHLRRVTSSVQPFHPSPLQLRYEVPADADAAVVSFTLRPFGPDEDDQASVLILVRRSDEPIEFEYELIAADTDDDGSGQDANIKEVVLVSGNWDLEVEPQGLHGSRHFAFIEGLQPGEVLHVSPVDTSPTTATLSAFSVTTPEAAGIARPNASDGAPADTDTDTEEVQAQKAGHGGCGCRRSGPGSAALWALSLLAARRRRCGS